MLNSRKATSKKPYLAPFESEDVKQLFETRGEMMRAVFAYLAAPLDLWAGLPIKHEEKRQGKLRYLA